MTRDPQHDDLLDIAIRGSLGGRLASAAADAGSLAWRSSASRRCVETAISRWNTLSIPQRIRTGALAGAVSMLAHRALAVLGPSEPLGYVVPLVVLAACVAAAAFANPIARIWDGGPR